MELKHATERVPPGTKGFYSKMFVVPKATGGWRPIIDLSPLNRHIPKCPFRMETPASIRTALRQGDWMTSIDLKDAYYHIPIHPSSKPYLRFSWQGQAYQFRALCFGLSTAPYLFTRVFRLISALAHRHGYRMYRYLDDWLLVGQSQQETQAATKFLLDKSLQLGLLVNFDKSELQPTQRAVFLGMDLDTSTFLVRPSESRLSRLDAALSSFLEEDAPSALGYLRLLGHMVSVERMIPLARLRIRPLQYYLNENWSPELDVKTQIPKSSELLPSLQWWSDGVNLRPGVPISLPQPDHLLHTDASKTGWGAHLGHLKEQGLWSSDESALHINVLELEALRLGLEAFQQTLKGCHVVAMTDNSTVVGQVRNQGGTKTRELTEMTTDLLLWTQRNQIQLSARHIPGKLNTVADQLSRAHSPPPGEWALNRHVCQQLWNLWGNPMVDLFATFQNSRLPLFFSPFADETAAGVDGLSQPWDGIHGYAYPPTPLIPLVLRKLEQSERTKLTLIAPNWPSQLWFPQLLSLLAAPPRDLGTAKTLLKQGSVVHQKPEVLKLHAWMLSSDPTETQDFRRTLPPACPEPSDHRRESSMNRSGTPLWIGATRGVLVHAEPLYHR